MSKPKQTTVNTVIPCAFQGNDLRVVLDALMVPWWIVLDLGKALDMTNIRKNVLDFPEDEKGVTVVYTPGGPQEKTLTRIEGIQ